MTVTHQLIEIIYSKDITNCLICGCVNESNGNFVKLTNCNHTFALGES
jgi:hypothetical protein